MSASTQERDTSEAVADPKKFAAAVTTQIDSGASLDLVVGSHRCELTGPDAHALLALLTDSSVDAGATDGTVTTGQAADILGVSRPTVVGLVDSGEVPATRVGTHRRILLRDLLAFQEASRVQTSDALDEVVGLSAELGLYEE